MAEVAGAAQAKIGHGGVHVQGVVPPLPFDPPYCYSVGFSLLDPPLPEVIVVGLPVACAGHLITGLFEDVRAGRLDLRPGTVVGLGGPPAGRVDVVLPKWAGDLAVVAGEPRGIDAAPVSFLQLVLTDDDGRWPEDPRAHPGMRAAQPLLGRERPWLVPIIHTDQDDVYLDQAAGDALLAMPTYAHGRPEARHELLRAIEVDAGRAVVCQVPWAADYVAVGDVVEARPPTGEPGVPDGALVGGAVLDRGPFQGLAFLLREPACDDEEAEDHLLRALFEVLDDLSADGWRARVSTTLGSVHVNSCEPEVVRAALRPFVRDGLLQEVGPRGTRPGK